MSWLAGGYGYRKKNTINGSTAGAQAVYPKKLITFANASSPSIRNPVTIGTSNSAGNWPLPGWPGQRCLFHVAGLYWVFYSDGNQMGWRVSTDEKSWSAFTPIRSANAGYQFCYAWDGANFHYTLENEVAGNTTVFYRMGTANTDGSITWLAAEQTVFAPDAVHEYTDPHISLDSNGYPWIVAGKQTPATADCVGMVAKSKTKNGTWTHEDVLFASPYQFSTKIYDRTLGGPSAWCLTVPLTGGKVLAIIHGDGVNTDVGDEKRPYANLWDGAAWVGEEQIVAEDNVSAGCISGVAVGDDVHLTYTRNNGGGLYDFTYVKRTYGVGWGASATLVVGTGSFGYGVLSKDSSNNLYAVWFGEPVKTLQYRKNTAGVWATPVTWLTETGSVGPHDPNIWEVTISDMMYDGMILFGYPTGAASPWNVRFTRLGAPIPDIDDQIQLNSHAKADFSDVKFTKADGTTLLKYWLEEKVDSDYAVYWVKFETVPASPGTLDYYVYYGNAGDSDASDGDNTFSFYDHFPGVALDAAKWDTFAIPTVVVAGSVVTVTVPGAAYRGIIGKTSLAVGSRWRCLGSLKHGAISTRSVFGMASQEYDTLGGNTPGQTFVWFDVATFDDFNHNGAQTVTSIPAYDDNNHRFMLEWKAGQILAYIDEVLVATIATNVTNLNLYDTVAVYGAQGQTTMDWTFVAGYVSPEPVFAAWGAEETPGGGGAAGGGGSARKLLAAGII